MVDDWDFNRLANVWEEKMEVNGYIYYIAIPSLLFRLFTSFLCPRNLLLGSRDNRDRHYTQLAF